MENPLNEIFALRLKTAMDAKGITINRLAEKCDIPVKKVKSWLDKKNCPRVTNIRKVVKALECSSDYLFGLKDL